MLGCWLADRYRFFEILILSLATKTIFSKGQIHFIHFQDSVYQPAKDQKSLFVSCCFK